MQKLEEKCKVAPGQDRTGAPAEPRRTQKKSTGGRQHVTPYALRTETQSETETGTETETQTKTQTETQT